LTYEIFRDFPESLTSFHSLTHSFTYQTYMIIISSYATLYNSYNWYVIGKETKYHHGG